VFVAKIVRREQDTGVGVG